MQTDCCSSLPDHEDNQESVVPIRTALSCAVCDEEFPLEAQTEVFIGQATGTVW